MNTAGLETKGSGSECSAENTADSVLTVVPAFCGHGGSRRKVVGEPDSLLDPQQCELDTKNSSGKDCVQSASMLVCSNSAIESCEIASQDFGTVEGRQCSESIMASESLLSFRLHELSAVVEESESKYPISHPSRPAPQCTLHVGSGALKQLEKLMYTIASIV